MEPVYQIVRSDLISEDYLKVYPGWIAIKKLRRLAYNGIGGAVKAGIALAAHKELKHLKNCICFDEIEQIEVKSATRSKAGIIQFYLNTGSRQTRANYLDLPTRTDAFHFAYEDTDTILAMVNYVNRMRAQGYPSILKSRLEEIREVTLMHGCKRLYLNAMGYELKKDLLDFLLTLHDVRHWKKYSLEEGKRKVKSGSIQYCVLVEWDQPVQWNSKAILYETDIVTICELASISDKVSELLSKT